MGDSFDQTMLPIPASCRLLRRQTKLIRLMVIGIAVAVHSPPAKTGITSRGVGVGNLPAHELHVDLAQSTIG
jgi:hypothetical protein